MNALTKTNFHFDGQTKLYNDKIHNVHTIVSK